MVTHNRGQLGILIIRGVQGDVSVFFAFQIRYFELWSDLRGWKVSRKRRGII